MAVVEFIPADFRAAYPQFDALTDAQLNQAFDVACLILDNTDSSPVPYCPDEGINHRKTLLYMLVCHISTLAMRGDGAVGNLTSATEGSVTATFAAPVIADAEWFTQTPCGLAYWQATARYRMGGRWYAACGH